MFTIPMKLNLMWIFVSGPEGVEITVPVCCCAFWSEMVDF